MAEMRRTTVRMPDHFYKLVEDEAEQSGLSLAGLIREAVLARILWGRAIRGESIYEAARQIVVGVRDGEGPAAANAEPGKIVGATKAVLSHAPEALDAILRALDASSPEDSAYVRELYAIPSGGFSSDAIRVDVAV